jgi:hypothetical protein
VQIFEWKRICAGFFLFVCIVVGDPIIRGGGWVQTSLRKESLNSDGKQFHQYQHCQQLPTQNKKDLYIYVGLNQLMESQQSSSDNWISNNNTNKQTKNVGLNQLRRSLL